MAITIERLVATLEAKIDKYEKNLARATAKTDQNFDKIERRGKRMEGRLAKLGKSTFAPLVAGALAALGPIALVHRALETISDASNLAKAADRAGIATTAFQELYFGFQLAGVGATEFERGMEQFSDRIGDAATQNNRLTKIFEQNDVALRDLGGRIRSGESLLHDYADLVKNAATEQEQMTLVTEAFGDRAGRKFLLALRNGSEGLDNMAARTKEAGGVIDEELLRRAEVLDDKFASAWRSFSTGAKSAILTAVDTLDRLDEHPFFIKLGDFANETLGIGITNQGRISRAFATSGLELTPEDERVIERLKELAKIRADANKQTTVIPTAETGGNAAERLDQYEREIELIQENTRALQFQASIMGTTAFEAAKLRSEQELINAALSEGKELTPELADQIDQLATAYASAEVQLQSMEQAQEDMIDRQEEIADRQADINDRMRSFVGSVVDDFRSGVDEIDAMANALDRLGDRLLEASLDTVFAMLGGSTTGLGSNPLLGIGAAALSAAGGSSSASASTPVLTSAPSAVSQSAASPSRAGLNGTDVHVRVSVDDDAKLQAVVEKRARSAARSEVSQSEAGSYSRHLRDHRRAVDERALRR